MFPSDPISTRQLHDADMRVAHQRRNRGPVVRNEDQRRLRAIATFLTGRFAPKPQRPATELYHGLNQRRISQAYGYDRVIQVAPSRWVGD